MRFYTIFNNRKCCFAHVQSAGICSSVKGIWAGGTDTGGQTIEIDSVTIGSLGNATDFGDLTADSQHPGGMSSQKRGVFSGIDPGGAVLDYITIASAGDSTDFGDCTACTQGSGNSNGHGGLDVYDPTTRV